MRLVEAVRLVDTSEVEVEGEGVPDGRIWAEGEGIELDSAPSVLASEGLGKDKTESARALMKHAAKTANGLYVVESEKMK